MKRNFSVKLSTLSLCSSLLLLSPVVVQSGPLNTDGASREVTNNSLADFDTASVVSRGCRYKALFHGNGEEVSTEEPCLACQCKGTVVVCKLRICPEIPVPPPPGCIVVHKAKSCCSQLICHGQEPNKKISREQRFPINVSNEVLLNSVSNETKDAGYCILDGTVYAEGSAMRSSTLCQYCFCIRGEMKCSSPQCVIPLNGCKPRFRSYACCPTNYDCGQSNETAILKTLPSSTQVPQFLKGCLVNGQFVPEGEPVLPVQLAGFGNATTSKTNVCQTCFCMGGIVHCRPLECDKAIDGCVPIKEDGHCCPDRYDCSKPDSLVSTSSVSAEAGATETSSSFSALLASTAKLMGSSPTTTTRYHEEEITQNTIASDYGAGTTFVSYQDFDSTTSANDDSFERIASLMSSSSEEKSSTLPAVPRARVSANTIGGFKNRSDLGSREERRSKDGDELSHKHSTEDDERDELAFHVVDTTITNAIEELAATTLFEDPISDSTNEPITDSDISVEMETTEFSSPELDSVTNNYISEADQIETTMPSQEENRNDEVEPVISSTESPNSPSTSSSESAPLVSQSSSETVPTTSSSSTSPRTSDTTTVKTSSTEGSLEFIPFLEDDVSHQAGNKPSKKTDKIDSNDHVGSGTPEEAQFITMPQDGLPILRPLKLKFINGTEELTQGSLEDTDNLDTILPIIVEKDVAELDIPGNSNTSSLPVSSSLYNNGYYPHGDIIKDDGPPDELVVSQGELENKHEPSLDNMEISDDELDESYNVNLKLSTNAIGSSIIPPTAPGNYYTTVVTTKRPEQPLKAISSNDKFIPSYSPATVQTGPVSFTNPSRTYTKFGMQDVPPQYRQDNNHAGGLHVDNGFAHAPSRNPSAGLFHHRYYNEPEEIPSSRMQIPYNYYSTRNSNHNYNSYTKPGNKNKDRGQGTVMGPPYKQSQFFYEDSSEPLDSYEDYATYLQTTATGQSTPPSAPAKTPTGATTSRSGGSTRAPIQFLGERVRLPSYNQQRATSTPRYQYAHFNSNKATTSYRSSTERTTTTGDFKQFPFSLPRSQDNLYNLGIKLSGCNVVGKMYRVGEIIDELSSNCLRCMCSDVGVHCAELKC